MEYNANIYFALRRLASGPGDTGAGQIPPMMHPRPRGAGAHTCGRSARAGQLSIDVGWIQRHGFTRRQRGVLLPAGHEGVRADAQDGAVEVGVSSRERASEFPQEAVPASCAAFFRRPAAIAIIMTRAGAKIATIVPIDDFGFASATTGCAVAPVRANAVRSRCG